MKTSIVAVLYREPEYIETRKAIEATGRPTTWVDRKGTGSLAAAYNRGFRTATANSNPDAIWFISNIVFAPSLLDRLESGLASEFAAIQPTYASDHPHLCPGGEVREVPYVEFTSPLVRTEAFFACNLDETMPYWGHDLDWSYRARELGWKLAADGQAQIDHTYIRHIQNAPAVTRQRAAFRKASNGMTERALIRKYGKNWRQVLGWK